jgi:tight adherence protein B
MGTIEIVLVATFVGVILLVAGPYWLFVDRSEAANQASLRQRVRTGASGATVSPRLTLVQQVEQLSSIAPLNAALNRSVALSTGLAKLIHQSGLRITVGQLVLGSGSLGLLGYILGMRYTQIWWVGLIVGTVALLLPLWVLRFFRTRRLRQFEEQFPEAIDLITRALRAGHAFSTGLRLAADELPQPVGGEFKVLHDQQNYGLPMTEAMRAFAQRIPIIDARFFVTAVLTQREAGGNLAEVLDNLSTVIRERFKIKRQLRVMTAHGRLTGWLLAALPLVMTLLLATQVPDHFKLLYEEPLGRRMIAVAVVLQITGALLIRKITDVEY